MKEQIDRVHNKTVPKKNPSSEKGNLKIEILHVDIHPTREGHITWRYTDGTSEKITMHGNGGTRFKDSNDSLTDWITDKKDHTDHVVQHMGLTKKYKFEKVDRQPGKNTWIFETKSGGVESVEISNPLENWSGFMDIGLTWTKACKTEPVPVLTKIENGIADRVKELPFREVPAKRTCCRALTPSCMACAAGLSVEDYCNKHPGRHGCAKKPVECNPQTGPSSGGCPMARCTKCPPHKNCKYVTEYRETGGRCCPIPCKRIETDKSCPDAGSGWGDCAAQTPPVDTETHRYLALSPKWIKSGRSCCKVTEYNKVERGRVCCKAMTKECLACQKDIIVDTFCAKAENSTYCTDYKAPATPPATPPTTPATPTIVIATEPDDTDVAEEVVVEKVDAEEGEMPSSSAIIAAAALLGILFMIGRAGGRAKNS